MATLATEEKIPRDKHPLLSRLITFGKRAIREEWPYAIRPVTLSYSSGGIHGALVVYNCFFQRARFSSTASDNSGERVHMNEPTTVPVFARVVSESEDGSGVTLRINGKKYAVRFGEQFTFTVKGTPYSGSVSRM